MEKINLTKLIAENTSYSRRQAEKLIRTGLVFVNDKKATLGEKHGRNSVIKIKGKIIESNLKKKNIYIKLNKPIGYVCTKRKFKGEKNIFSLLQDVPQNEILFSIGRLDKDSSGLLLLTNDGFLNYYLSHPRFEKQKKYLVEIAPTKILQKELEWESFLNKMIEEFKSGIDIKQETLARAKKIKYLGKRKFQIILSEGKKRQIREMFKYFGLKVIKLKRIEFAGIKLDNLPEGKWSYLSPAEEKIIKNGRGGRVV